MVSIMPSLSIKDVPEPLLAAIRRRAARNHRSLQGELMALLEAAAGAPETTTARPSGKAAAEATRSFAEAAAEFRSRFPARPAGKSGSSAEFIREMRDTHYGEAWVMARIKDGHWPPQPGDSEPLPGIGPTHPPKAKKRGGKS
jgi:plasmid stability protein